MKMIKPIMRLSLLTAYAIALASCQSATVSKDTTPASPPTIEAATAVVLLQELVSV